MASAAPPPTLDDLDRVIHEPARLLIAGHLAVVDSADFVWLCAQTGLTRGNLSSHLSKLEEAGYVAILKEFVDRKPRTLLRLTDAGRRALTTYVGTMQRFFSQFTE